MKDDNDDSPLDVALESDNIVAAHYILSHGGNADKSGAKLLCGACEDGEIDVVKELVEKYKVDPNCELIKFFFSVFHLLAEVMANYSRLVHERYTETSFEL